MCGLNNCIYRIFENTCRCTSPLREMTRCDVLGKYCTCPKLWSVRSCKRIKAEPFSVSRLYFSPTFSLLHTFNLLKPLLPHLPTYQPFPRCNRRAYINSKCYSSGRMRTVALRTDLYIFHLVSVLHRFTLEGTDSPAQLLPYHADICSKRPLQCA